MSRHLANYTEAFANWNNAFQLVVAYGALVSLYNAFMRLPPRRSAMAVLS